MQMSIIYLVSLLLTLLPLLMAVFFLMLVVPRKLLVVQRDLETLRSGDITGESRRESSKGTPTIEPTRATLSGLPPPTAAASSIDGVRDIDDLMSEYFSTYTLIIPAVILTCLYAVAFLLCDTFVALVFGGGGKPLFFLKDFALASRPDLFSFLGVYLFNIGTMTRRVYLADMNEQVFWGAINRLLLSMGLAIVLSRWRRSAGLNESLIFFTVGFLANIVLQYILEKALQLLNVTKPKRDDLALQMVKGINIWKEYRLEEEGIESVQNLATADLLELAVRTHYSIRTLIDWIDQSVVLSRFSIDQIKKLSDQTVSISAIDLAASSPQYRGSTDVSDELATTLGVSKLLMANTLNSLFEDRYVRELWRKWQSGDDEKLEAGINQSKSG